MNQDLLELPYADRQLIVVVSDRAAAKQKDRTTGGSSTAGPEILRVGPSAASELLLPPGHPRRNIVYIGHPMVNARYYPMAWFHRLTLEHKFVEAIRLLIALGATSLRVESVRGWSQEMSAGFSAHVHGVEIGPRGGKHKGGVEAAFFEATLSGSRNPHVPEGLVWYEHEAQWREIADARLHAGLEAFTLKLTYDDDFGVNIRLEAMVAKNGFQTGGSFEKHVSTLWELHSSFRK